MSTLTFKNNSYASHAEFRPLRGALLPAKINLTAGYPWQGGSRSVSDAQHLSSFRSAPDLIDSLFAVEGADVYRYVQRHPQLLSLLLKARAEAYWLFGPGARVVVRMEHDPEGEFEARLLVAIQTGLSAALALRLVDLLDDRWWLSVRSEARVLMKIDVEYI
jgi:hypothetical protein